MPTLSIFFGIVIRMYYDDHPPPHLSRWHCQNPWCVMRDAGAPHAAVGPVEALRAE
ncbi:MAG TPA: hypothetical protein VHZ07_02715 [Bryobacteraceae bacterium]|jgi:hypothetical protein|nr:hypothetical protein [Bryobacteraceae bacterium]